MNFKMDFYVQILKIPIGMICYDFWPVMCMFNLTENRRMLEHVSCCMVFCMQCWFSPVKTESVRVMISKGSQRKKKKLNFSDLKNCSAGQKIKNNNKKTLNTWSDFLILSWDPIYLIFSSADGDKNLRASSICWFNLLGSDFICPAFLLSNTFKYSSVSQFKNLFGNVSLVLCLVFRGECFHNLSQFTWSGGPVYCSWPISNS